MAIIKLHQGLVERFDHLYYASLVFLLVKILDIASTSVLAHEYGTGGEQTRLTRWAMDQFGINAGLIIKNIPVVVLVLGFGFLLNRMNRHRRNRVRRNLGSVFVYGITLPGLVIVINNGIQIFG